MADRAGLARAVDREPVAAAPAGLDVRLVAGERDGAAAVRRATADEAELVGDRKSAGGCRRGGLADRDAEAFRHGAVAVRRDAPLRKVCADRPRARDDAGGARRDPGGAAVR